MNLIALQHKLKHGKMFIFSFAILFFSLLVGTPSLGHELESSKGKPTLPGEPCRIIPVSDWTSQEKWVWKQVCEGKIANFSEGTTYGGSLDPKEPKGWSESRIIRPAFLETILFHEPYTGALTRKGVRIIGAWIREPLEMSNGVLTYQLWLDGCRFESVVDLFGLKSLSLISFRGSKFKGKLNMDNTDVGGPFFMGDGSVFSDVSLKVAKIDGELVMKGSEFNGKLDMDSTEIGGSLHMHGGSEFKAVVLRRVKIDDQLNMRGSKFNGKLDMEGIEISWSLLMDREAEFDDVVLMGAKIGDQLAMNGSKFNGKLNMNYIRIDGSLIMHSGAEFTDVDLIGAKIGDQLAMNGSKFSGKLNMYHIKIDESLFMRDGAELEEVDLRGAEIGGRLDMVDSKFKGELIMDSIEIDGNLFMHGDAEFAEVVLRGAKIGGTLFMNGSKFNGKLKMDITEVHGSLMMHGGAEFAEVDLRGAKIGKQLTMNGSKFNGKLKMYSTEIAGSLLMNREAEFDDVVLIGVKIGDQLAMNGSKFKGELIMDSIEIDENLIMRRSTFEKPISLIFAKIGSSLNVSGSTFSSFDLTDTEIKNEFHLGSETDLPPNWKKDAKLILRNTHAGALQDLPTAWPDKVEIVGFTYSRLGGFAAGDEGSMATRPIEWMKKWLNKQKGYSPQPYQQLAKVLKQAGYEKKARDILYAGREKRRSRTKGLTWVGHTLEKYIIGYGYHNFWTVYYICGFILLGWLFIWKSRQQRIEGHIWSLVYSLDMLIPIMQLDKKNYDIHLSGLIKYYFYVHKLIGYILAFFLIAGFSGLTK